MVATYRQRAKAKKAPASHDRREKMRIGLKVQVATESKNSQTSAQSRVHLATSPRQVMKLLKCMKPDITRNVALYCKRFIGMNWGVFRLIGFW